jgi:hypothetical protein
LASAKGTLLKHLEEFIVERHGQERWRMVLETLSADDRAAFEGLLLAGNWYPVGVWNRALKAYMSHHLTDTAAEMTAIARFVADRDLNTLFKVILRMRSAEFVLSRTDSLWSRYFDVGEFQQQQTEKRRFALSLNAPVGEDEAPGELTCGLGVCGWLTQALELTGAKNSRIVHTRCRFRGAPQCEYDATW